MRKSVKNIIVMLIIAAAAFFASGCGDRPVYVGDHTGVFLPEPTEAPLNLTYSEALLTEKGTTFVTPTPEAERNTRVPAKETKPQKSSPASTATPAPTALVAKELDADVSKMLSRIRKYKYSMSETTPDGLYIYCGTEKKAEAYVMAAAQSYAVFPALFADSSLVRTPEYYMELYPEITSLSVDYSRSGIYTNGILIMFTNVETKAGANLLAAIRTGNESKLSANDKWTLDEIRKISDKLGMEHMSDIDKVLTAYDYIIKTAAYDSAAADSSHKAYGVLKNGKAVCDGYAETFMLFMKLNGIEAEVITGKAEGGTHAWNQVKVDGKWYNLDLTWDDPIDANTGRDIAGHVFYKYFMVDDKELGKTHKAESSFAHSCSDNSYRLYGYNKYMAGDSEAVVKIIESQKTNKYVTVAVPYGTTDVNEVLDIYHEITGKMANYFPVYSVGGYKIIDIKN